jgi:hypothetical protein
LASIIRLSDGVTTLDLNDKVNYRFRYGSWPPQVPIKRTSLLGGRSLYDDVDEEMHIDVLGISSANALANLASLYNLLDQARRWNDDENVNVVAITYKPDGSSITSGIQGVVLGTTDESPLSLSPQFNDVSFLYEIQDVVVKFKRRSLWESTASTEIQTSSFLSSGDVCEVTFAASLNTPVPARFSFITGSSIGTGLSAVASTSMLMLFAKSASKLVVIEAEALVQAPFTSVADAANKARGNVLRYVVPDVFEKNTNISSLSSMSSKKVAVYVTLRTNNPAASYLYLE